MFFVTADTVAMDVSDELHETLLVVGLYDTPISDVCPGPISVGGLLELNHESVVLFPVTVVEPFAEEFEAEVAVIVHFPGFFPVTIPSLLTVAIDLSDVVHFIVLFARYCVETVSCLV